MDPASYLQGRSRETTIRRDACGRWFHDGAPVEHPNLVRSFDRWIARAEDGRYCLKNDINWAYVAIEGPPVFVRSLRFCDGSDSNVSLVLSNDREVSLDPVTLRQAHDGALYCDVPGGAVPSGVNPAGTTADAPAGAGSRWVARFDRHAQAQLERILREDADGVYLALGRDRVRPPTVDDPLALRS